jgi:hypothetical protein
MQIIENYNSSVGKYGKELTEEMEINGINPKYYLLASRFHIEIGTPINILSKLFKQWEIYVRKNDKSIDVNNLSFNEFRDILNDYKRKFGIPNKIYDDGKVSIGKITSYKDIARFPIKNEWCISKPNQFQQYIDMTCLFQLKFQPGFYIEHNACE